MIDKNSEDYKIALFELGQTVSSAISHFKEAVGAWRCSLEAADYEYDDEFNISTGRHVRGGNKIGINVYPIDEPDDDDDEA